MSPPQGSFTSPSETNLPFSEALASRTLPSTSMIYHHPWLVGLSLTREKASLAGAMLRLILKRQHLLSWRTHSRYSINACSQDHVSLANLVTTGHTSPVGLIRQTPHFTLFFSDFPISPIRTCVVSGVLPRVPGQVRFWSKWNLHKNWSFLYRDEQGVM